MMLESNKEPDNPIVENPRKYKIATVLTGLIGFTSIAIASSAFYIAKKFYVEPNKTAKALDLDRAPQPDSKCTVVATDIGTKSSDLVEIVDGTYNPDSDLAKRFNALVKTTNNGVSEAGATLYLCMLTDEVLTPDPILDPLSDPYWDIYSSTGARNTIVSLEEFNMSF
ncbi:hypothetical protein KC960_01150 [Candidatus Saccharibacteria bacterium]|nr:hypothetical protein [Candidatus Saccharibacteria bacterium]